MPSRGSTLRSHHHPLARSDRRLASGTVTNGPTEAVNIQLKRVKLVAFGITNWTVYRTRALLDAGKPNWLLLAVTGMDRIRPDIRRDRPSPGRRPVRLDRTGELGGDRTTTAPATKGSPTAPHGSNSTEPASIRRGATAETVQRCTCQGFPTSTSTSCRSPTTPSS